MAQLLNLRAGAPLLRIRQVIYSSKTKPVIYVIDFYRSEKLSLHPPAALKARITKVLAEREGFEPSIELLDPITV